MKMKVLVPTLHMLAVLMTTSTTTLVEARVKSGKIHDQLHEKSSRSSSATTGSSSSSSSEEVVIMDEVRYVRVSDSDSKSGSTSSTSSASKSSSDSEEMMIINEVHESGSSAALTSASEATEEAKEANKQAKKVRTSAFHAQFHGQSLSGDDRVRTTMAPGDLENWKEAVRQGLDLGEDWDPSLRKHVMHDDLTTAGKEETAPPPKEEEEPTEPTPSPHLFQHIDSIRDKGNSTGTGTTPPSVTPTISPKPSIHIATPSPSSHPTKKYHPPVASEVTVPTVEPTTTTNSQSAPELGSSGSSGISFFRMMGKMIAWCILMGLAILLYGFCIQHKYQIAYYARHAAYYLNSCAAYILQRLNGNHRQSHNLHRGYAAMYASERNDALSQTLFDGTSYDNTNNNNNNHSPPGAASGTSGGFGFGGGSSASGNSASHGGGGMMSMMFQSSYSNPNVNDSNNYDTSNGFIMPGQPQPQPQPQQQPQQQNWQ